MLRENARDQPKLTVEVADALAKFEHYGSALKYYALLEGNDVHNSVRKIVLFMPILSSCHNIVTANMRILHALMTIALSCAMHIDTGYVLM